MKIKTILLLSITLWTLSVSHIFAQEKPNVIVIMADDLGYADVSFNGSVEIPTPNIDRIANNGVKFTSAYTTYSVCGPSRAGFITGRYQQRFGFERNPLYRVDDPYMGLPFSEMTIAESIAQVGYKSSIIGKWHLGSHISNHPLNRGFDEFYGHLGGGHNYFPEDLTIQDSYAATNESKSYKTWIMRNHKSERISKYLTDEFSEEAVDFVSRHQDNPFFLFVSYNAPHSPLQATTADLAQFPNLTDKRKTYAAMVHAVDRGVGMLMDKLEELEMDDNTIVFFLSDNGGPETKNASDNGVLRGQKSDVFEGGFRVPFAMQWKGQIDGNAVYDHPVSSLDIFATLAALSGAPTNPDKPLDGVNLIPYLKGENTNVPHQYIYLRKFDQDRHAVRHGDYKILYHLERSNQKLYNITTNISENDNANLYWNATYRTKRDEMDTLITEWEKNLLHPCFLGLMHEDLVWATSVNISEISATVEAGGTKQLSANAVPVDAFSNVINWTSNCEEVATVDQTGKVSAHKDGYALITARVVDRQQVFSSCIVKVGSPIAPTSVQLSENEVRVLEGEKAHLSADVKSSTDAGYAIEWASNNPAVASVTEEGFVITHKRGMAIITAKVVGFTQVFSTCTVYVSEYSGPSNLQEHGASLSQYFSIYPNPAAKFINVEANLPIERINIYNVNGEKVYTSTSQAGQKNWMVNLPSHWNNGVYFVENYNAKGVTTKRFILSQI